jgi:class 3 adenylate cyclase/tetratricopeptide (TPR) repeat protein
MRREAIERGFLNGAAMQDLGRELAAYAPDWVIASLSADPQPNRPFAAKRSVCALFADVADFSAQTERFALRGARGAEDLSAVLNDCFSLLVDVVHARGGDIVAFAGDAVAAVWEDADVRAATLRATDCALSLQETLREWAVQTQRDIRLRISIETGDAVFSCVGGLEGRWRYLVSGEPLRSACANYRKAGAGQVLLCPAAHAAVGDLCAGDVVDEAFLCVTKAPPAPPAASREARESPRFEDLQALAPKVVLDRLAFADRGWLAEFRNLSIVAIQPALRTSDADSLEALQKAMLAIQATAARYEGAILDVIPNDAGFCAYLALGLPPYGHSDNAYRAAEAAKALHRTLASQGVGAALGVAGGRLFCGEYGGGTRRQYSVLGHAINLASRLMAVAGNGVLCDLATARAVGQRMRVSPLGDLRLKGISEPTPVFRPEAALSAEEARAEDALLGRDDEQRQLEAALDGLARGERQVVMLLGEAGAGKSRLLAELVRSATLRGLLVYRARATAIERRTLYYAWREIPLQLAGASRADAPAEIRAKLVAAFAGSPQLSAWAPLLEDVVHAGIAQTELTSGITGAARASGIEQLVLHLLDSAAARQPTVLSFDDLHFFDGASAALLVAVARRASGTLIAVASRTNADEVFVDGDSLPVDCCVRLGALPEAAVADFVRRRLGVGVVPEPLLGFIQRHAGGNPFFCEELLLALRDTGAIAIESNVCRIDGELEAASRSALSVSVEGAVVGRIDALPPQDQMALKVASAIGGEFSPPTLCALYPDSVTVEDMSAWLDRLTERELLRRSAEEGGVVYDFRHAIIRQVTHEQLSFAQRRALHRQIADEIERAHGERLGPFHALLSTHRELADQIEPAIGHLDRAAEQALRNYANRDAIGYARKAKSLAEGAALAVDNHQRSVWEISLGDAYHELREFEEAARHYEKALYLLNHPIPATSAQTVRSLLGGMAAQLATRLRGGAAPPLDARERLSEGRAAHVYERLGEEYFYLGDSLRLLHGTVASLNLAERSGSTPETISGYNGLALALGMSGLKGAARFYSRRAFQLARESGAQSEVARAYLVASVLTSGLGDWSETERHAREGAKLFRELGDYARLQNVLIGLAFARLMQGETSAAERLIEEISDPAIQVANDTVRAWTLCLRTILDTSRSVADEAQLDELREIAERKHAPADRLVCLGALASAHERRGEAVAAFEAAERGFEVLQSCQVVWAAYGVYGAAGVVTTLIRQCERERAGRDSELMRKARAATRHLARASRASLVCRPATLLHRGSIAFMYGREGRAAALWRRAAHCAEELHMPYFSGLVWLKIASGAEQGAAEQDVAIERARRAFQAVGATADLATLNLIR